MSVLRECSGCGSEILPMCPKCHKVYAWGSDYDYWRFLTPQHRSQAIRDGIAAGESKAAIKRILNVTDYQILCARDPEWATKEKKRIYSARQKARLQKIASYESGRPPKKAIYDVIRLLLQEQHPKVVAKTLKVPGHWVALIRKEGREAGLPFPDIDLADPVEKETEA